VLDNASFSWDVNHLYLIYDAAFVSFFSRTICPVCHRWFRYWVPVLVKEKNTSADESH
jgi:hypothetical protein